MRKLGLIGGTGPESTIAYYRGIAYGVQEKTGRFPKLCIESLSVFEVLRFCEQRDYAGLADYLVQGFSCLAKAGADFACLTGITPHVVYDEVLARSPIPIVSMVETACEYAQALAYHRIALLGTYPTMSGEFFQRVFRAHGIEVVTPTEAEMRYIGEKIETELELGNVAPKTQKRLCEISERLVREEGAQAVVLGCTELPMILNSALLSVPCMNVMEIHIQRLVDMILKDEVNHDNVRVKGEPRDYFRVLMDEK